jgi:hypothetical protein
MVDRRGPQPPTPAAVQQQVTAMLSELDARWPGGGEQLGANTVEALSG